MCYKKHLLHFITLHLIICLAFSLHFPKAIFNKISTAAARLTLPPQTATAFLSQNKVHAVTLLNSLEKSPDSLCPEITLYYSTSDESSSKAYTLCINNELNPISPLHEAFISYTEGFMPVSLANKLLSQINHQKHISLHYFYNAFEDESYYTFATIGDLSHCFFISKDHKLVRTPITLDFPLEPLYLNHLVQADHTYYLLGDTVNAHSSHLYTLDSHTLQVTGHFKYETSSCVIYRCHSTLDALGHAYFIAPHGLLYADSSTSNTATSMQFLCLDFTPSYLISDASATIALSIDNQTDRLHYAELASDTPATSVPALDNSALIPFNPAPAVYVPLPTQGTLPLPDTSLQLVEAHYQEGFLYLLTFAPHHPLYTNYLLIYDLNSQSLIYCCGLENALPYMPTHFSLPKASVS